MGLTKLLGALEQVKNLIDENRGKKRLDKQPAIDLMWEMWDCGLFDNYLGILDEIDIKLSKTKTIHVNECDDLVAIVEPMVEAYNRGYIKMQ